MRRAACALAACVALAATNAAHDGPPYALLVDAPFAGSTLYFDPAEDDARPAVSLTAWPADGRLAPAAVAARAVEDAPYQLLAEVPFDRRGAWKLRLTAGPAAEALVVDVEVTPPGSLGPIDVVWFLAPFAAVAFLWLKALRQRRRAVPSP